MKRDIVHAWRLIWRTPALSIGAIVVLALGIGLTTALFSVLHAALLKPLPYKEAERLLILSVGERARSRLDARRHVLTGAEVETVKSLPHVFEAVTAFELWTTNPDARLTLVNGSHVERLRGGLVARDFFDVLGVQAALGRTFQREDAAGDSVVISDGLWRRRFDADPTVIGRVIRLEDFPRTIVGVLPRGVQFTYPEATEVWSIRGDTGFAQRSLAYHVVARIGTGVSSTRAEAVLSGVAVPGPAPTGTPPPVLLAQTLKEWNTGTLKSTLWLASNAAGLLLLTACASACFLLLARAIRRVRATALYTVLGASRLRLLRQHVVETGLVGFAGTVLGVLLTVSVQPLLARLAPTTVAHVGGLGIDAMVLGFAGTAGLLCSVAAGLAAYRVIVSVEPASALAQTALAATTGRRGVAWRRVLLTVQTTLAVALLAAAVLFSYAVWYVSRVDLGFRGDGLAVLQFRLTESHFRSIAGHDHGPQFGQPGHFESGMHAHSFRFRKEVHRRLLQVPGIQDVAITSSLPFKDVDPRTFVPQIRDVAIAREQRVYVNRRLVSPEFFRLFGIRLLAGRSFWDRDDWQAPRVAIVSASLAQALFGQTTAVGRTLHWGEPHEIVGVVDDVRWRSPAESPMPAFYLPAAQTTSTLIAVAARTVLDPGSFAAAARSVVAAIDSGQPVDHVTTMDDIVAEATADRRFYALVATGFGVLALVLAVVGVFGAVEAAVTERVREIGIRVALGAAPGVVLWDAMRQGLMPAVSGLAFGMVASFWVHRGVRSLVPEVGGGGPIGLFVGSALILIAVSALAAWLPARLALRIDPALVLRRE